MSLILNLIWLICGGLIMAIAWFFAGLLAAITIVGLPWSAACFRIGSFTMFPFGREAVDRRMLTGREDIGTGPLGTIANILWLLTLGIPLAIGHVVAAIACAVTIIGIPFAWQHIKLAGISLWPVGTEVVDIGVANAARRRTAFF
ncbi:MAG TPA: YccF domain-containing protein [Acetobacteraceae bacterium]|nr:YccF domain-containing protein [Acetobacteraceae bacterium]